MSKTNILIFPASGENSFNIYNALKYNLHFNVFGVTNKHDHTEYVFDNDKLIIDDFYIYGEDFFNKVNSLIQEKNIKFIIPTHDEIALFLMKNKDKINAVICCSPLETTEIAFDKEKIYEVFSNEYFCPQIYNNVEEFEYPVFSKPKHGAGSKGVYIIQNLEELYKYEIDFEKNVYSEYLPGEEYTIDCFTDRNGTLKFAYGRTRERIVNGITNHSTKIEDNSECYKIAELINKKLKFRGAWFFQVKKDKNNKMKLLEISVRQAGTMIYFREYGINFPLLTLFDFMEYDINIIDKNLKLYNLTLDRCLHDSFKIDYDYENIYIDFDDTIICNNLVNTKAIMFLYQSLNNNKNIYLITRHENNIFESLKKYHIDREIFKEIIILDKKEYKSDKILKEKSIFIDNYYKERIEVSSRLNIPVFDVDSIECLINDFAM